MGRQGPWRQSEVQRRLSITDGRIDLRRDSRAGKAEFAEGAFGEKATRKRESGAGAGRDGGKGGSEAGEGEETGSFRGGKAAAELAGGGAEDAAQKGWGEGPEAIELE